MKKDFLDDVPLPKGNELLFATAALTMAGGSAILVKPQKMHDLYFEEKDEDEAPQTMHEPTTRWLGVSLLWVGGMNLAAGLAPHGPAKKKLLVANGALLAGASRLGEFAPSRRPRRRTIREPTHDKTHDARALTSRAGAARHLQPVQEDPEEEDERRGDGRHRSPRRAEPRARHQRMR